MPSGRAGGPLLIIFTLGLQIPTYCYVKIDEDVYQLNGTILGVGVPSLSNGIGAASPPLVVVGGITFIMLPSRRQGSKIQAPNLSESHRPVATTGG